MRPRRYLFCRQRDRTPDTRTRSSARKGGVVPHASPASGGSRRVVPQCRRRDNIFAKGDGAAGESLPAPLSTIRTRGASWNSAAKPAFLACRVSRRLRRVAEPYQRGTYCRHAARGPAVGFEPTARPIGTALGDCRRRMQRGFTGSVCRHARGVACAPRLERTWLALGLTPIRTLAKIT